MSDDVKERKTPDSSLRNIFALGFVSFFTDVSTEMVLSLLPVFIVNLPGSGSAALGVIEGIAESISHCMRIISGVFSDKLRGRKILIFLGYAISNIAKPFFAVTTNVFEALAIRVTDRVGKGIRTSPRDALLSESIDEKRRGMAFGLHRTLDQMGAILGPLTASLLLYIMGLTVRNVFWLSLIPGSIALLILILFVQERPAATTGRETRLLYGISRILKGDLLLLLLIMGIFSLGAFNYSFVLLNASEAGFGYYMIPILYALINLAHTLIAIPSGILSDRIAREKVLIIGYGAFLAVTIILFLSPRNYFAALLMAILFGAYDGIVNTVGRALIPKYVSGEWRGTAYGLYYLIVGMCFLIANTVFGGLWQFYSPSTAALYSMTLALISIIGMILFIMRKS